MTSKLYAFILNNWIMGKDESYVQTACNKGYVTEFERDAILATPQVN